MLVELRRTNAAPTLLCPWCRSSLDEAARAECSCGAAYHVDCWRECREAHGTCAIFGCSSIAARGARRPLREVAARVVASDQLRAREIFERAFASAHRQLVTSRFLATITTLVTLPWATLLLSAAAANPRGPTLLEALLVGSLPAVAIVTAFWGLPFLVLLAAFALKAARRAVSESLVES